MNAGWGRRREGEEEGTMKGTRDLWGGGYFHCLDYGDGFVGIDRCDNLSNCIPNRAVYFMTIRPL
jgi:hypothetical protein